MGKDSTLSSFEWDALRRAQENLRNAFAGINPRTLAVDVSSLAIRMQDVDALHKSLGISQQMFAALHLQLAGVQSLAQAFAKPLIPEGALKDLSAQFAAIRLDFPVIDLPKIDPAILKGWDSSLLDAYDHLQRRAAEIAAAPDTDVEDINQLVATVDEVTSSAPEKTKRELNRYLLAIVFWLLDKAAEDPAKAAMREMLARMLLVLSLFVNPTPPPVPVAIPASAISSTGALVISGGWQVEGLPGIIRRAGPAAQKRTVEFFTVTIRNRNTRQAYANALMRFFNWCDDRNLELGHITPFAVAAYVEEMQREFSAPTVKQHLAAIRMLFDWLVTGQVIPSNPAQSVRGPRHSVSKGSTPALSSEEATALLTGMDVSSVVGLRDRAIISVMTYTFARVGAVVALSVEDYFPQKKRWWLRLKEKNGKVNEMPCHHKLEEYLDAYITAAEIADDRRGPLFRSAIGKTKKLGGGGMSRTDVWHMVRRRTADAGIETPVGCHTFRATGITDYLTNGGRIEVAQRMAGHSNAKTTGLYDRRNDDISVGEVERIGI